MPVTRTLKNPNFLDVAQARSDFEAAYGPADLLYYGSVYDPWEQTLCSDFPGPLVVNRLHPRLGQLEVLLLDGFYPWVINPVEPYRFDIVAQGKRPRQRRSNIDEAKLWPEWTALLRPYADANKLGALDDILTSLGFRKPVLAPTEGSITASFRSQARRCGIYVLRFANGEYYVGQTVDITRRFAQHRKRHGDIAQVSFRPIGRRSLDFHEAQLIWLLELKGFRLRNIDMTSILITEPGSFDELMDAEHQQRWLTDCSFVDLGGERVSVKGSDGVYKERYATFKSMALYKDVFPVVHAYVRNALPAARSGEASYWQTSVLPPGYAVLVRINVNWQEVFFVNTTDDGVVFFITASRKLLQQAFGDDLALLSRRYAGIELEEIHYRAGGSDQITAWLWDAPSALRFVNDPEVLPAIRHYTLRLMKKGKSPWARFHNFDLVTDILGEPAAPAL